MTGLFLRLFTGPFYRRHTGFFAGCFIAFFGAVQPHTLGLYHRALMQTFLSSPALLALLLLAWSVYGLRVFGCCRGLLLGAEGRFLFETRALGGTRQVLPFAVAVGAIYLPLLVYAALMAAFAVLSGKGGSAVVIAVYVLLLYAGTVAGLLAGINRADRPGWGAFRPRRVRKAVPFRHWLLQYTWKELRFSFVLLKAFSLLLLYIPLVWNGDRYDHDSIVLFLVVLVAAHSFLAFRFVGFLEGPLSCYRNLPVGRGRLLLFFYVTYLVLLLPEGLYLYGVGRHLIAWPDLVAIWLVPVHTLLFLTAVQYGGAPEKTEYMKVLAGLSFVSIFFFNGEWYGRWMLGLGALGAFLFFVGQPTFEKGKEE
ncbi:hypothetical protein [Flaviaesturariibacter amylovorans]|uniref:ABC transporter permease n=1 Tax=Flaviaesturariibacter amylovorans TaxID=1084520 RepID=A0ABP8GZ76_9BACT